MATTAHRHHLPNRQTTVGDPAACRAHVGDRGAGCAAPRARARCRVRDRPHGWRATGVDFSPVAIRQARHAARAVPDARFIEGDATKLTQLDITRPIDLVIDMGGYHSLPHDAKRQYVAELSALLEPGTPLLMWQGIGLRPGEIPDTFGHGFVIEGSKAKDFTIRRKFISRNVTGCWYWLRRR